MNYANNANLIDILMENDSYLEQRIQFLEERVHELEILLEQMKDNKKPT